MAYFLTIALTAAIAGQDLRASALALQFVKSFAIGAALGFTMGMVSYWIINNIKLGSSGLYPVLVLGLSILTYSVTQVIRGNGFLAVYLCALFLGSRDFIHKRSLLRFFDGQAWLMQIALFLTLGLLVFPSQIIPIMNKGMLIAGFLMLIARPLGVFLALSFSKTSIRSKIFISWVGLRGAVPIVFATFPMIAGLEKAGMIFNLAFFISVSSVLLQGTTLPFVARLLKVTEEPDIEKKDLSDAN